MLAYFTSVKRVFIKKYHPKAHLIYNIFTIQAKKLPPLTLIRILHVIFAHIKSAIGSCPIAFSLHF